MKKLLLALATLVLVACSQQEIEQPKGEKAITFHAVHNYGTRATLEADGGVLTDLWILDYMDGVLVQSLHQTSDQTDFAEPTLPIAYGSHHIYFVGSRGVEPTLDTDAHTLTFGTVRDTFWKDYAIDVTASTSSDRTVMLDRVVTRLRMVVNDEVPAAIDNLRLTISTWFFGIDYITGEPTAQGIRDNEITVPDSYKGTTGNLSVSVYGFSGQDIWTTDIAFSAVGTSGETLGSVTIADAPFKRNRITQYSGNLFASSGQMGVGLNTAWDSNYEGSW